MPGIGTACGVLALRAGCCSLRSRVWHVSVWRFGGLVVWWFGGLAETNKVIR